MSQLVADTSPPCQESGSRGSTHGQGVRLVEKDTFFLQLIDVGRHHELVVALKVTPSGVIGHNENDVRRPLAPGVADASSYKEQVEQHPLSERRHDALRV